MYTTKINHMNLHQIANSGQCFRWQQINDNTYKIPAFGKELTISQDGDLFTLSCDESEWNSIWRNYFDLDTNYDEVEEIIKYLDDDFLKIAYEFGSGIMILRQNLWEVIVSFIISQNNNIPRIKKSIQKLCDSNNGIFPLPWKLEKMDLSNMGLGYRDKYIKDVCTRFNSGEFFGAFFNINCKLDKKQLMETKGIVTREEVSEMRNKVKNIPNYKPLYDYFEQAEQKANYYKANPEQHLKDIFNAKMNGTIK